MEDRALAGGNHVDPFRIGGGELLLVVDSLVQGSQRLLEPSALLSRLHLVRGTLLPRVCRRACVGACLCSTRRCRRAALFSFGPRLQPIVTCRKSRRRGFRLLFCLPQKDLLLMESPPLRQAVNQPGLPDRRSLAGFQIIFQTIDFLRRSLVLGGQRLDAAGRIPSSPGQILLRIINFVLVVLLVGLSKNELIVQAILSCSGGLSLFGGQPLNQRVVCSKHILSLIQTCLDLFSLGA